MKALLDLLPLLALVALLAQWLSNWGIWINSRGYKNNSVIGFLALTSIKINLRYRRGNYQFNQTITTKLPIHCDMCSWFRNNYPKNVIVIAGCLCCGEYLVGHRVSKGVHGS